MKNKIENNGTISSFKTGDIICVVVRDNDVFDIEKVIFLAQNDKCVIATCQINDYDIEDIILYHIEQTQEDMETHLLVYPIELCFATKEEAEQYISKTGDSNG